MPQQNASYRSLELLCRKQAALTGHEAAKRELEEMAREYKRMADWQDQNPQPPKE